MYEKGHVTSLNAIYLTLAPTFFGVLGWAYFCIILGPSSIESRRQLFSTLTFGDNVT